MMLVFGGNTHNDTAFSTGDKCFSADLLAYDIGQYFSGLIFRLVLYPIPLLSVRRVRLMADTVCAFLIVHPAGAFWSLSSHLQ